MLINHGAEVKITQPHWDETTLHIVNSHEIAEILLKKGCDPNAKDKLGIKPLEIAFGQGNLKTADVLVAHGADIGTSTNYDKHKEEHKKIFSHQIAGEYYQRNESIPMRDRFKKHSCIKHVNRQASKRKAEVAFYTSEADSEYEDESSHHQNESGRRVRARSLIDDEQLAVLKGYYTINPRPKKEEITMIANYINFPTRVVQVWYQNARARDRREAKIPALLPLSSVVNYVINEQPLDLSKKDSGTSSSVKDSDASSRNTTSPYSPKEDRNANNVDAEDQEDSPLVIDEETVDSIEVKQLTFAKELTVTVKVHNNPPRTKNNADAIVRNDLAPSTETEQEGHYCCNQCDKTFSKHGSLARHKYEHSGEKIVSGSDSRLCGRKFCGRNGILGCAKNIRQAEQAVLC